MLDGPNISSDPRSMYRILGADRKEYGPVSADDIRVWIREGRANGQTLACSEGGAWQPLSSFPEFAQALGAAPASPSPLPAPSSSAARVSNPAQLVQGPGIVLVIVGALGDRDWRVRVSAAKTLAVLQAHLYFAEIDALRQDRDPHVRKAARWAARRLYKSLPRSEGWWTWR